MMTLTYKEMRFITKNQHIKRFGIKGSLSSSSSSTKSQMIEDGGIGHYVVTLNQLLAMSELNS